MSARAKLRFQQRDDGQPGLWLRKTQGNGIFMGCLPIKRGGGGQGAQRVAAEVK